MIHFSWDEKKSHSNFQKHGVSFNEAMTVFYDDYATEFFDAIHSENEERFLLLGMSSLLRLLIVCHCVRENNTIRIITARKATKKEAMYYRRSGK